MRATTLASALLCATALTAPAWAGDLDAAVTAVAPITATNTAYAKDWAVAAVNTLPAYNAGWNGTGQVVAVFGTGINALDPDLKGEVLTTNYNSVLGMTVTTPADVNGHDTFVAGMITGVVSTASSADQDLGIASGAKLMSVQIANSAGAVTATDKNLAAGITYATGKAGVFNNSWNTTASIQGLGTAAQATAILNASYTQSIAAWQKAVAAGTIVVWAAGNNSAAQPGLFAGLPELYSGLQSGWLVGVATDNTGKLASYSNACGLTAAYCMAAPGNAVVSTYVTGGLTSASGTSFAAPVLSGAAAVLKQRWPTLTASQILSIMFNTATKTGIYANSAIYGQGLLNLGAAVLPQGTTTVTTAAGTTAATGAVAATSAAFGGAMTSSGAIVMVRDAYGRDYQTTLNQFVASQAAPYNMTVGLAGLGTDLHSVVKTDSLSLAMTGSLENPGLDSTATAPKFVASLTQGHDVSTVAHGLGSAQLFGGVAADVDGSGTLAKGEGLGSAYLGMTGRDAWGAATSTPFYGNSRLTVAGVYGAVADKPAEWRLDAMDPTRKASQALVGGAAVRVSKDLDGATVGLESGMVHEANSVLGSVSEGSMALGSGADTQYVGFHGELPLAGTWSAFGSYEAGRTAVHSAVNSMVGGMSTVTSDTWSLGVTGTNTVTNHDRLTFLVSQPMRVNGGTANLVLPTSQDDSGNVSYSNVAQSMAAGGREMDLQVGYHLAVGDGEQVSTVAMLRTSPDNIQGARAEGVLMTKYRMAF